MRIRGRVAGALGAAALLLRILVVAPAATGSVGCSVDADGAVLQVTLSHDDDWAIVARERGGPALLVNGQPCGDATVRTVDRIRVVGGPGLQMLTIDLSGGPLGPGRTPERTRVSEIEVTFDGGPGDDVVHVVGGPGADTIGLGAAGAALGRDGDTDVWWWSVEQRSVDGGPGPDRLRATSARGVSLRGGGGDDVLIGGAGRDRLDGGGGRDRVWGGAGIDRLIAGPDPDRVFAGGADDLLWLDDGRREREIDCGGGLDEIRTWDPGDLRVATRCDPAVPA